MNEIVPSGSGVVAVFDDLPAEEKRKVFDMVRSRVEAIWHIAHIEHLLPMEIDRWMPTVLDWMRQRVVGCGPEVAEETVELAELVLGCKKLRDEQRAAYVAILAGYPADLLVKSVREALGREKYHVMPTPGALCADARMELERRNEAISRLRIAISRLDVARSRRDYYQRSGRFAEGRTRR